MYTTEGLQNTIPLFKYMHRDAKVKLTAAWLLAINFLNTFQHQWKSIDNSPWKLQLLSWAHVTAQSDVLLCRVDNVELKKEDNDISIKSSLFSFANILQKSTTK